MLYDAVQRHLAIEKIVTRMGSEGLERKYYRVRMARWYGGVVTADCVGCGLTCKFCWVSDTVMQRPVQIGKFFTARKIADSLIFLAKKHRLDLLRVSGGEPTLGKPHLLQLLENLQGKGYSFILETNGIPMAYDQTYAKALSKYGFVHVRVSLKGCNEKEFAILTGAKPEGFILQLEALKNLVNAHVKCHPSVMASFSPRKNLEALLRRLKQIDQKLREEVEIEELILYPHVARRIQTHGLKFYTAHKPEKVPPEQI